MALIEYDEYKQKLRDLGPELDKLSAYFEGIRRRDGFIYIPKECGVFVCRA